MTRPPSPSTACTSPVTTGAPRVTTGVIGALELGPRRRAPARTHAAEGEERPPGAPARDARQLRPDLGPLARDRPLRAARTGCRADRHRARPRRRPPRVLPARPTRRASMRSADRCRRRASCSPTATTGSRPRATTSTNAAATTSGAGAIMTLVVELAPEQLCVRAIHRLLTDLPPVRVRDALAAVFDVRDAGANDTAGVTALESAMRRERRPRARRRRRPRLARTHARSRRSRRRARSPAAATSTPRASMPRCSPRSPACHSPTATTPPPSRPQWRREAPRPQSCCDPWVSIPSARAAAAHVRMPEKTTFFAPKPRTGMVFRSLDR